MFQLTDLERDAELRRRLRFVYSYIDASSRGESIDSVAAMLGVSPSSARAWTELFFAQGPKGLRESVEREDTGCELFRFHAFISHSNPAWAQQVCCELRAKGLRVWSDEDILNERLIGEVEADIAFAISQSRYILVLADEAWRDSIWCQAEHKRASEQGLYARAERVLYLGPRRQDLHPAQATVFDSVSAAAAFMREANPPDPRRLTGGVPRA